MAHGVAGGVGGQRGVEASIGILQTLGEPFCRNVKGEPALVSKRVACGARTSRDGPCVRGPRAVQTLRINERRRTGLGVGGEHG